MTTIANETIENERWEEHRGDVEYLKLWSEAIGLALANLAAGSGDDNAQQLEEMSEAKERIDRAIADLEAARVA